MLVPTMAFAWWLVSLPVREAPPMPVVRYVAAAPDSLGEDEASPAAAATAPADEQGPEPGGQAPAEVEDGLPAKRVLVRSVLTAEMVRTAQSFLDLPLGAERPVGIDGHSYVFVLEPHYHPPGFVGAPTGWHKGVTIYEVTRGDLSLTPPRLRRGSVPATTSATVRWGERGRSP